MVSLVAFGDNVVDCYPDHSVMFPGGNTLNVSVFARRSGARASYVGAVGDDDAGRHIRDALGREGVDISRLRVLEGDTAFCIIGNRMGEREFLGANLGVSIIAPDEADFDHVGEFDAIHTGRSSHVDAHVEAFANLTRLSFDFAVIRDPPRIAEITPHCFLASFSAGDLSHAAARKLCETALEAGARWCLATRGANGAILADGREVAETGASDVEPVDTLGAGDAFIARTLVGLLNGENPSDVLAAATRAAGDTCARLGAFGHRAPMEVDMSSARDVSELHAAPARPSASAIAV